MDLSRRSFMRQSLVVAAAVLAKPQIVHAASSQLAATGPQPCPPSAWTKHGIVLEPTETWEGGSIQNFTCPAEPVGTNRWRIWYSARGKNPCLAYAEGVPGEKMQKFPARCSPADPADAPFAIGHLPEDWNPTQVVHLQLRNGRQRIYFWVHGRGIARYLAADSEDGRRYTVTDPLRPVLYHPHDRAAQGIASPDGVMMTDKRSPRRPENEPVANSRLISNDATNIYQLADGSFEMYSVGLVQVSKDDPAYVAEDNAPGLLRVIDRYTSEDGLHFENRQRIIQRDANDPADQQFYYLAVTHTPQGRVGMLGNYRCVAQTMDLEWCFSPDGKNWQRSQRKAWLPRGDEKQPDSYGIYAPSRLVNHAGKWHLFYTAVNSAHNGKHSFGTPRSVIMHATTDSIWTT